MELCRDWCWCACFLTAFIFCLACCMLAAVPTYPIYKHQNKPPRSFSLRILSKLNQVSDVKTPQSTSYTVEPMRE
ncbi:hypothetical protein DVH24_009658 [Malus domestica]|uniref:Uncharacterized protein n=1 Tax=Malus domestica TaxID=3750 RepID=A0A498JP47_MALDO|nr:hypothetical protein DVH24_009658 [Malus domestica]